MVKARVTGCTTRRLLFLGLVLIAASVFLRAQEGDEPAPVLKASALLTPALLKGPHHSVADAVATEGFFHQFTVSSEFGSFEALGRSQLAVRIHEIDALFALQDVSKTEVFLTAAGQSVVNVGKSAAGVVTDPSGTAKNMGSGVKRFGVNLGRRTKRAVDSSGDSAGDENTEGNAATGAANSVLGVNSAMRRWAQKVGVDPYTTNPVLREALEGIAKVDSAGSIATKVVVPIPAVVGMTSSVGSLVWSKDPEEVRKINEQRLRDLRVPEAIAKALAGNRTFTLTAQTRLIAALHAVNVRGCADYAATAAVATNEREALFFVESAEMLQERHAREQVSKILSDSRALVAALPGGKAVALLPLDWVRATSATTGVLRELAARAKEELGATTLDIHLTGRASPRLTKEIPALGWRMVG